MVRSPAELQSLQLLHRMDSQLSLSTNQHAQIEQIMRASQDRTKPLWDLIAPEMGKELARLQADILKELTPDQQKQLGDIFQQTRQHRPETAMRDGDMPRSRTNRSKTNVFSPSALPTNSPQTNALPANQL